MNDIIKGFLDEIEILERVFNFVSASEQTKVRARIDKLEASLSDAVKEELSDV